MVEQTRITLECQERRPIARRVGVGDELSLVASSSIWVYQVGDLDRASLSSLSRNQATTALVNRHFVNLKQSPSGWAVYASHGERKLCSSYNNLLTLSCVDQDIAARHANLRPVLRPV